MWAWVVVAAVLVSGACKGKDRVKGAAPDPATVAAMAPKVSTATVLANEDGHPPVLYLVDATGTIRLAAATSWADLDARTLRVASKTTPIELVDRFVREQYAFGKAPLESVTSWDELSDLDIDLASLEDTRPSMALDDPPPPEEEETPDDGEEESGGTGTMVTLDEGKMGKKDSDRAEGQYKMLKDSDDPQLARQQALEWARSTAIRGSDALLPYAARDKPLPNADGSPTRVAEVAASVAVDGKLLGLRSMILIAASAKATSLIDLVRETDGAIAVSHEGKIRPLHLQFGVRDDTAPVEWLEARVSTQAVVIEAVPDAAIEVATLDGTQLAEALDRARSARDADPFAPVDVLVDADVDVQRLIDVVVALDLAGVRVIGMGAAPSTEELARRGHRVPKVSFGQPNVQGDLDKVSIRRALKSGIWKIRACYAKALVDNPGLYGTVVVQFFIMPSGDVANASAVGVDPSVAECVGGVVKALTFPKPKGGGGAQVNYPFTMRP
ncbi:MAG: AgmX/PglI C-terminal domain-containing protein [Myxococcales bacterium]|nr:AgmX/PglI C-terminal domain-containing protein [Myxococcales bacterium]